MSLRQQIIANISKTDRGLEIGPSINPVAPKCLGYDVETVDHCSKTELVEKYKTHEVSVEGIEEVDYVWKGESLSELVGKTKCYDYIIASHLIEHTPDPLGFLRQCELLLKDSARIYLLVPDKRFCFDYFRPIKTTGDVIQAYLEKRTRHIPATVFDHIAYACKNGTAIAWWREKEDPIEFVHTFKEAEDLLEGAKNSLEYMDVHGWVFTPSSMRLIIKELNQLRLLELNEVDFQQGDGFEFLISLARNGPGCRYSRLELVERIHSELTTSKEKTKKSS